jgi:bis(5'-nucleosyl)-tetraphosphatase (symmetrical)
MSVTERRRVFIGDVHGCLDELVAMEKEIGLTSRDEIVLVGDLINKGPDSLGVLDWVDRMGASCLQGNHEAKFLQIMGKDRSELSEKEHRFLGQFGGFHEEAAARIENWPLWLEWPDLVAVHAGLEPGCAQLESMRKKCLLTIRTWDGAGTDLDRPDDPAWYDCVQWPVPVVFGHWAMRGLVDRPDVKGLDTGCVYGGKLTAWSPDEARFWQVQALRPRAAMEKS